MERFIRGDIVVIHFASSNVSTTKKSTADEGAAGSGVQNCHKLWQKL